MSKEIIEALRSTNISLSDISRLTLTKFKLLLENQTNISRNILDKGIVKEISFKARFLLYSSIGMLTCALTFGAIWISRPPISLTYNGLIFDKLRKEPINNAIVKIDNRPDITNQKTDSKGLFQLRTPPTEITLTISHENYKAISLRKEIVSDNELDTIMLEPISQQKVVVSYFLTCAGHVSDLETGRPLYNVKIEIDTISIQTLSNGNFYTDKLVSEDSIKRVEIVFIKPGYFKYSVPCDLPANNLQISLTKIK